MGPFNPFQQMQQSMQPFGASGAMPDALAYLRNYWGQPQQPMQSQPQPQPDNGLVWIRGEEMATSYPYPNNPGDKFILMDTDSNVFYVKARGAGGEMLPMRTYDYFERKPEGGFNAEGYVTREEFDAKMEQILKMMQPQAAEVK